MARPCLLTPETEARILEALRAGNYRKVAAEYAGVDVRTFQAWMQRGKRSHKGPFGRFRRAVLEAERQAEMRMVALVMRAASEDAKHAQWWLERKHNARWGRKEAQRVEVSGPKGGPVETSRTLDLSGLTVEELRAIRGALEGAGGGEAGGGAEKPAGLVPVGGSDVPDAGAPATAAVEAGASRET